MTHDVGLRHAARLLRRFLVVDVSGSIAKSSRIGALNHAVEQSLRRLAAAERDNPGIEVLVQVAALADEAWWLVSTSTPVADLGWTGVQAV